MNFNDQVKYWAHMLDESTHISYYAVYMQEHPEDESLRLIDSLIGDFARSLQKDDIDLQSISRQGKTIDEVSIVELQNQVKHKYHWNKIKAQTYAAIISRMTALMHRSKGQRLMEDNEIEFDDVSHLVSRRTIEECLDIICHNTNVLEANHKIVFSPDKFKSIFKKHGIPPLKNIGLTMSNSTQLSYAPIGMLYAAYAAFAKGGRSSEQYVADSVQGPPILKKILDNVEYAADVIDLIVALNKCLDVVHFRNDLASAFIEGGQRTCALVSNLPDKFVI